jgi:hypothetical protein
LVARFVAVADADRAAPLFGDPLTGAAFFVGAVRPGTARFPVTDADRFAGALVVLAGAVAAFFGDRAALALDALPVAAGGFRPVVDDLAVVWAAGVRDDVADAFVVARFVGRAAFAAGVLGTVVTFAARDVPDRDARPPRPTAAMATPSWSELDTHCLRLRFRRPRAPQRRPRIRAGTRHCHWARRSRDREPGTAPAPRWPWAALRTRGMATMLRKLRDDEDK